MKLVPVVALPALVCVAWPSRRRVARLAVGFFVVFLPLWLPPVISQWSGFKSNVLEYNGVDPKKSQWGIVTVARHLHAGWAVDLLTGPGRFALLLVAALVPAWLVLRNRNELATVVSLSLALFLLFTPTFGTQYLVWAAIGVLFFDLWWGAAFNAAAGVFYVVTYTDWSGGFPWNSAHATLFTPGQERLMVVVWVVLAVCCALGIRRLARRCPMRR